MRSSHPASFERPHISAGCALLSGEESSCGETLLLERGCLQSVRVHAGSVNALATTAGVRAAYPLSVDREGAIGGEGKPGEAFADAVVGGGVGVELVRQRQFGKIGLTV